MKLLFSHPAMVPASSQEYSKYRRYYKTAEGYRTAKVTPNFLDTSLKFVTTLKAYQYLDAFIQAHELEASSYLRKLAQHPHQEVVLYIFSTLQKIEFPHRLKYVNAVFVYPDVNSLANDIHQCSDNLLLSDIIVERLQQLPTKSTSNRSIHFLLEEKSARKNTADSSKLDHCSAESLMI